MIIVIIKYRNDCSPRTLRRRRRRCPAVRQYRPYVFSETPLLNNTRLMVIQVARCTTPMCTYDYDCVRVLYIVLDGPGNSRVLHANRFSSIFFSYTYIILFLLFYHRGALTRPIFDANDSLPHAQQRYFQIIQTERRNRRGRLLCSSGARGCGHYIILCVFVCTADV